MDGKAENPDDHNSGETSAPTGPELMASLAEVLDAAPADLTDGEVIDALVGLIDLLGRTDAAVARFAGAFDTRALGAIDGARTTGSWLAARTELSRPVASAMTRTGHRLRACPHVDAAARQGRLGHAKVSKLLAARVDVEDLFAAHEQALVDDIEPMTVAHATVYIDQWRHVALATEGLDDGPEPADDCDRNRLKLSQTYQGRWALDADLDAASGEALKNQIDHWIDQRVQSGDIDLTEGGRDRAGLNADALLALVGIGADHPAGTHQPRASITLSWDADDLLGKDLADLAELDHRNRTTSAGTTLAFDRATELLCNAEVNDILVKFGLNNTRTILGVTHTRRHPTKQERTALDQRDRGCVFPGCHATTRWCHAHHITPYEIGQRTRLDDLVLLCGHHHRAIHQDFTLTRNHTTGHITITRPDGTTIHTSRSSPHPAHQGTKLPIHPSRTQPRFTSPYLNGPNPDRPNQDDHHNSRDGDDGQVA